MAMMALGPVVFSLVTNLHETEYTYDAEFAEHQVVGAGPIYEATGDGETPFTLSGKIMPEHLGVDGSLAALEAAKSAQLPLPLMRGDYFPVGFVLIKRLRQRHNELNEGALGREIHFTVDLLRVGAPSLSIASQVLGLFR
ncbi:phage tail protein [Roseibium alexandrii]|uniref:phage tail protein n=1 Tax=Roseibium alexandrii TaxID=388408 RepID=UPI00375206B8